MVEHEVGDLMSESETALQFAIACVEENYALARPSD